MIGSFLIFVQKLIRRRVVIRMSWCAFFMKFRFQRERPLRNYNYFRWQKKVLPKCYVLNFVRSSYRLDGIALRFVRTLPHF